MKKIIILMFAFVLINTVAFGQVTYEYAPIKIEPCLGVIGNLHDVVSEYKIVSLFNDREIEGSFGGFILGYGHVGETEYYYFMKEVSAGVFIRGRAEVRDTYIVETDIISPHTAVLQYTKRKNRKSFAFSRFRLRYLLVVPPGTIIREFQIK